MAGEDTVVLVSACLAGLKTRYDGRSCEPSIEVQEGTRVVPVCPEQLGGLTTPRAPSWIEGESAESVLDGTARVVNADGEDVTESFLSGARQVAEIALSTGAGRAILKDRSPSCGVTHTCRGGEIVEGTGVTAARLIRMGIEVEAR